MAEPDPGIDLVARHLAKCGGPPLGAYKDRCLRRRLAVRMRACGSETLAAYAEHLAASPGETELLLEALTINVTQFFRNPEVWDRLATMLAVQLSSPVGTLRAWSAGCASGEEPYSLALLVARSCPNAPSGRLHLDASDIDARSLQRAQAGRYPAAAVVGSHPLAAGLVPEAGHIVMPPGLRAGVRFMRNDLLQDPPPAPPYHLILCRNVLIYFEREAQERLFTGFTDALLPGGLLVLGRVETIFAANRDRLELVHNRERIYRKRQ